MASYALVFWTDENKTSIITLSKIKEPRKSFEEYAVDDEVKASCHGFPGTHKAKILAIKGSTIEDKRELERLSISWIEANLLDQPEMSDEPRHDVPASKSDTQDNNTPVNKHSKVAAKRKPSTTKKTNKENTASKAEKEIRDQELKASRDQALRKNQVFLKSLENLKDKQYTASTLQPRIIQPQSSLPHTPEPQPQNPSSARPPHPGFQVLPTTQPQQLYTARPTQPQDPATPTTQPHLFPPQYASTPVFAQLDCTLDLPKMPSSQNQSSDTISTVLNEAFMDECCQGCAAWEEKHKALEKKIKMLEIQLGKRSSEAIVQPPVVRLQKDKRPRAGVVPPKDAKEHHMAELLPNSGVFVYSKDLKVVQKKETGTAVARYLMSVFWTNGELIEAVNLTGRHNRKGLDQTILEAICSYTILTKPCSMTVVKMAMRSKMSALICKQQKKS